VRVVGLGKLEVMDKLDSSRAGCFRPVAIKDNLGGGTVEPALLIGIRLGPGLVGWDDLVAVLPTGFSETVTRRGPSPGFVELVPGTTDNFARTDRSIDCPVLVEEVEIASPVPCLLGTEEA
jgi:hypothetical protein